MSSMPTAPTVAMAMYCSSPVSSTMASRRLDRLA